mmetsp:Transcript_33740/g.51035  ORF Transcript_33740/g.51035 Transcript_33740/m.51035 type:complete len:137 (-) Transcript_33740:373-783(-)
MQRSSPSSGSSPQQPTTTPAASWGPPGSVLQKTRDRLYTAGPTSCMKHRLAHAIPMQDQIVIVLQRQQLVHDPSAILPRCSEKGGRSRGSHFEGGLLPYSTKETTEAGARATSRPAPYQRQLEAIWNVRLCHDTVA